MLGISTQLNNNNPRGKSKPQEKSRPGPKPGPDIRNFFRKPKLSQSLSTPDQTPVEVSELPGNPAASVYTCTQPQNGGKKLIPGNPLNSDRKEEFS